MAGNMQKKGEYTSRRTEVMRMRSCFKFDRLPVSRGDLLYDEFLLVPTTNIVLPLSNVIN